MTIKEVLFYLFSYVVEALILRQYSAMLFAPKHSGKVRDGMLALCYLIAFAFSFFDRISINMLSFTIVNFAFLYTQYNMSNAVAFFHSFILTAIMSLSELVPYAILSIPSPHFLSDPSLIHTKLIFGILGKTLYFLVAYTLAHMFRKREKEGKYARDAAIILGQYCVRHQLAQRHNRCQNKRMKERYRIGHVILCI